MFLTIKSNLHFNCILMLNWLFEIELFFDIETVFSELFNVQLFWRVTVCKQNLYWY